MGIKKSGFTLLEIIVVIALLGIVGVMAVDIFFTSLRGGTKAETLKEIKQNGDFAISVMERMIRNAQEVTSTCDGSSMPSITIRNPDYYETTFECVWDLIEEVAYIASSSAAITSKNITLVRPGTPSPDCTSADLTFTCSQTASKPETVSISFTLYQKGVTSRPEERASVTFETTISLRNY